MAASVATMLPYLVTTLSRMKSTNQPGKSTSRENLSLPWIQVMPHSGENKISQRFTAMNSDENQHSREASRRDPSRKSVKSRIAQSAVGH